MAHGRENVTGDASPLDDRDYCRWALPRVSRTFALNIRLLGGSLQEPVRTAYLLCRIADALEDSWQGTAAECTSRFAALKAALAGDVAAVRSLESDACAAAKGRADMLLVAHLHQVLNVLNALPAEQAGIVRETVQFMAAGMQTYATRSITRGERVPYLDDESELHDYCHVVAGCVGEMLTRLFTLDEGGDSALLSKRLALSPLVGEALQLTNILLDQPSDLRRGRCYLPASWLAPHGLTPAALCEPANHAATRELMLRLQSLAIGALDRVPEYLALIPARFVRYRLFCLWPAAWARASVSVVAADADFPFGPRRPRLTRESLFSEAMRAVVAGHSRQGVRWLLRTGGAGGSAGSAGTAFER